jgi:hypothetical protein
VERPTSVSAEMRRVTLPLWRTMHYRAYRLFSRWCSDRTKGHLEKVLSLSLFFWFLFPCGTRAQVITASLQGQVLDPSGAVVPGASVVVTNTATNVETHATTGQDGFFLAPSLPPGPYVVTIKASGFKTLTSTPIVLEVDRHVQEHFTLQVGAASQSISVRAAPPLLEPTTSAAGTVVNTNEIMNLPLNARISYQLAFLAPGIHGTVSTEFNGFNMQVNGGRPGTTLLLIDGIPSSPRATTGIDVYSIFPPVDATEEFNVQTSNYSAQFGDAGSGIINLIYKTGTNELHGDVYEFLTNSALNSNLFFDNADHIPLPEFQRSQFGFTLGGPIVIPKIYNGQDKTFFFGDFEGLRQGTGESAVYTVPTTAMRAGDFSNLVTASGQPVTIYNPDTTVASGTGYVRSPFAGNIIPTADISPVSAKIANYWPAPNLPGDVNNFTGAAKATTNINNYDVKVDENVSDKDRFSVRWSQHVLNNLPQDYFTGPIAIVNQDAVNERETGTDIAADDTYTWSPSFLTEFRLGFARMYEVWRPQSIGFDPTQLGFPSYIAQTAQILAFPGISPSGYEGIGDGGPDYRNDVFQDWPFYINNTWIHNGHTLNFGFELEVDQVNVDEITQADGNYSFTAALTQGPNPQVASSTAGNGFATFMLGIGSGDLTLDSKNGAFTGEDYAGYLQDDWRVRPKFTLNLGLRYEVQAPRTERYNRLNYFDPTATSPLATAVAGAADCPACADLKGGLVFVGTNGVGRRQFPTEWGNVAPRFGFAYEVTKNTVVRGGFGLFYEPSQATGAIGTAGQYGYTAQTPYTGSPNGLTPSVYLSNPFPTGIIRPTGNTEGLDTLLGTGMDESFLPSEKVPLSENWNFDIQRQLPGSILVDAAYVGSRGLYLDDSGEDQLNLNQLSPAALALGSALTQSVPNPFYGLINVAPYTSATIPRSYLEEPFPQWSTVDIDYLTGAQSIYNSFQLKVVRRFTSGLSLLAAYTGEKTIDDYSIIENEGQGGNSPQNYYDLAADRAVSSNDISQDASVAAVYQLPFGRGLHFGNSWSRLTNAFLGGWQLNGILTEQTGFPLTLSDATNTSDSGSLAQTPNYNPSGPGCTQSAALSGSAISRLREWFNTACFTQPAPYTFGNVGRTMPNLRMDPYHDLDFSVFKNFRLGERFNLQFHAESFNLFNQVQFGYPNESFGSPGFGSVTSQENTPREIQFALKLLF